MLEVDRTKLFCWGLGIGFVFSLIATIFTAVGFEWCDKTYTTKWDWFKFGAIVAGGMLGQAVSLLILNLFGVF